MEITEITEDNVEQFMEYIDPDACENIGRRFYRAVAVTDDDTTEAAMIWELKHAEDEEVDTEGRLDWISVTDASAKKLLFEEYASRATEEEVTKSYFKFTTDAAGSLRETFEGEGFETEDCEGDDIVVTIERLLELPMVKKTKTPPYIVELGTLKSRSFRSGVIDCMYHIHRELPEDLAALSLDWYEPDVSCYEESDGNIDGFLLVHRMTSGKLRVELLADWGPDEKKNLMYMVRFSILRAAELYPHDTEVVIHRHDSATFKLSAYLFPEAKGEESFSGQRQEG
ncbi:MAG: hypothetical protein K6G07_02285 [Lachnospiraceae bacterium]|nr:hypothetical protein [Lachnospiraceae bacterium]